MTKNALQQLAENIEAKIQKLTGLESKVDFVTSRFNDDGEIVIPESARQKISEDVLNHLETLPTSAKGWNSGPTEWQDVATLDPETMRKHGEVVSAAPGQVLRKTLENPAVIVKALDEQSAIPGSPVDQGLPYFHRHLQGDPFLMAGAFQHAPAAAKFSSLEVSDIAFANETSHPLAAASWAGQTAAISRECLCYTARIAITQNTVEDQPGLLAFIEQQIRRSYMSTRASLTRTAITAGARAGNNVQSGAATTGITKDNGVAKLLALRTVGSVKGYLDRMRPRPAYVLSPEDQNALIQAIAAAGSGWSFDPTRGVDSFLGHPAFLDVGAADATADDNKSSWFGSWDDAVVQAQFGRLILDAHMSTLPGAVAIYSSFRFTAFSQNNEAMSQINIGA